MKTYKSKKERRSEEHERRMIDRSPLLPVVYMLGIVGIVLSIGDLLGLSVQYYFLIFGAVSVLTMLFWYLYTYQSKAFLYVTGIVTIGSGLIMIPQAYSVASRVKYLLQHNYPLNGLPLEPAFLLTALVLLTFFLFSLEFVMRSHALMFAVGLVLMILVPIFGHTMSIINMIMLVVFETGFAVINMTDKRSLKNQMKMPGRSHINLLSMLLVLVIVGISVIPAFVIESTAENELFNLAYRTDSLIKEAVARLMGDGETSDLNSGNISRGNLYQTGAEQLSVTIEKVPQDTLYIKGFVGKDYSDSNWSSAYSLSDDYGNNTYMEPFMENVFQYALDRYVRTTSDPLPYAYYYLHSDLSDPVSELHYMMAKDTMLNDNYYKIVEIDGSRYLQVQSEEESKGYLLNEKATNIVLGSLSAATRKTVFVPYYAKLSPGRSISSTEYSYRAYFNSVLSPTDIKETNLTDANPIFTYIQDEYKNYVDSQYINYPNETFARLEQLCNDNPLTELNTITTFILVTLQNRAVYTTTPGNTPYNKDVIDYFLFENGKGYCVHFASAAALMYRMYGIPARYVTGFVAQPTDFRPSRFTKGYFTATLTDKSAHAWVEIYLDNYGWVPVEVTPGTDGFMHAEFPGYNESVMRFIMDRYGWKFNGETNNNTTDDDDTGIAGGTSFGLFTVLTMLPFIAMAVFAAFLLIRRRRLINALPKMTCQRLYDRIIKVLHYSKLLKDMNGSEKDFPQKLSEIIHSLSAEDCQRLQDILLRANYSAHEIPPYDRDFVQQCLTNISGELYAGTNFFRKISFKFIHAFI